jgi:hypothetical protein
VRGSVSRYALKAQPVRVKKGAAAQIKHLQAPTKGLSISSELVQGDALTASILDNWIVEKDRVTVRPGIKKTLALASQTPIETIVPWYGYPSTVAYAQGGSLFSSSGALLRAGFQLNDWAWTAFSNLGKSDYTVMVNGGDGVWSWDGGSAVNGAPLPVVSLSNANPAVVTVAAADIGKFHTDQIVKIVGADATHAAANGDHQIGSVNNPANTFTLLGVNTSAAAGAQTTGVDVTPYGSLVKETITAPIGEAWVNPLTFHVVLSHMNRLWFADPVNLAVYYLPLQQKSGQLKLLPLNALFRRGGYIVAIHTWTLDGGAGTEDQLVVFSSGGEAVIYGGTDPDSDFQVTGIFRFDSPMSKHSVFNYGGDLYVLISTGLVPLSTMLRAESEQLGKSDKNVTDMFWELIRHKRHTPGFATILDYDAGWAICNIPTGAPNSYRQMIRFMPDPVWASWSDLPSRCWQWLDGRMLIGSDDGIVYEFTKDALSDDGSPIVADLQLTWSSYNSAAIKAFRMISPYILTDGAETRPYIDLRVDYDSSPPFNQPDVSVGSVGALWNTATWDVDYWAQQPKAKTLWNGVAALGRVAAPRVKVAVVNCTFSLAGFDIVYEQGSVVG